MPSQKIPPPPLIAMESGSPDAWNESATQEQIATSELTVDAFPLDASESADTDGDGVGDNSDAFPEDPAASIDSDGDGAPDAWNESATEEQIASSE